jgi:hypothetical protein
MSITLTHFLFSTLLYLPVFAAAINLITVITDMLYNLISLVLIYIHL